MIRRASTRSSLLLPTCCFALSFAAAVGNAQAKQLPIETLRIDAKRSHADFSLRAMFLVVVRGQFMAVSGSVNIDHERNLGWVDARIDARSVEMGNHDREEWARSSEFFDSTRHPEIRFVSDPISRTLLREGGPLRGRLSLRGIDRIMELTVSPADCEQPGRECPLHVQGSISRSDFGMVSKRAVLGDKVSLDLSVFVLPTDNQEPISGAQH
ncbi:MAG: YceI family protein [Dokdonella sp.]